MADWGSNDPVVAQTPSSSFGASDEVVKPGAAKQPDKYHQAALDVQKQLQARGFDTNEGYSGRFTRGMTLGAAGDLTAALSTPLEMMFHGTMNPVEGWRYAKAMDDVRNQEAEQKTGMVGKAAELAGGLMTGAGAAKAGLTFLKPGMTTMEMVPALAKEGAAYGGVTGFFNGGDNLADKAKGAASGAAIGGMLGAATPVVGKAVGALASPFVSAGRAFLDPKGMAGSKFAEALANSGKTAQQIEQELIAANAGGQTSFTAADAMGNAGQRALSSVTRSPGPGRQPAVEFLENRQAGQGRRIANALSQGFDAPQTAAQTTSTMTAARSADAATNYGAARGAAGAVDVSPAIKAADNILQPGVNPLLSPGTNIADNSVAGAVQRAKSLLTDGKSQLSDFGQAHLAKQEIDALIEGASPTVQRTLIPIRNALDDALAASSKPYAAARDAYRQQSQAIDAVQQGRSAATRGRTEDTIPAFQGLAPEAQQGFRAGYADPLIEQAQGGAMGVNKARPFTSDAYKDEINAFAAPGRAQALAEALGRENTMFETRAHAVGGSRTADNLADESAFKLDPGFIAALFGGHWGAAARQGVAGVSNLATGTLPSVRAELGKMLLAGHGAAPQIMRDVAAKEARANMIANLLRSGAMSARGTAISSQNK